MGFIVQKKSLNYNLFIPNHNLSKEPNCFWPKKYMADGPRACRLFAWSVAALRYGIIV
jgi:hypothetical protein